MFFRINPSYEICDLVAQVARHLVTSWKARLASFKISIRTSVDKVIQTTKRLLLPGWPRFDPDQRRCADLFRGTLNLIYNEYKDIPRGKVCRSIRLANQSPSGAMVGMWSLEYTTPMVLQGL